MEKQKRENKEGKERNETKNNCKMTGRYVEGQPERHGFYVRRGCTPGNSNNHKATFPFENDMKVTYARIAV